MAPSTQNVPRGEVRQKDLPQVAHPRCSHLPGLLSLLQLCSQQAVAASSSAGLQSLVTYWLMSFTELRRHCRAWQRLRCTKPGLEINAQLSPGQHCNHTVQQQHCPNQHTDTGKQLWDLPENSLFMNLKMIWANADEGGYRKVPCSIPEVMGSNSGANFKPSTSPGC